MTQVFDNSHTNTQVGRAMDQTRETSKAPCLATDTPDSPLVPDSVINIRITITMRPVSDVLKVLRNMPCFVNDKLVELAV